MKQTHPWNGFRYRNCFGVWKQMFRILNCDYQLKNKTEQYEYDMKLHAEVRFKFKSSGKCPVIVSLPLLPGSLNLEMVVTVRVASIDEINVWKLFVLDMNTWNLITVMKLFVLDMNTWNLITVMKLFVLDMNTWNLITVMKLFVLDMNTWNLITVMKLFVLEIVTWTCDCLPKIFSYLEPYNCLTFMKSYNYKQIICIKNSCLKLRLFLKDWYHLLFEIILVLAILVII